MRMRSLARTSVAAALVAALGGCAGNQLGGLGEILGAVLGGGGEQQGQGQLLVEVQQVDTRQQAIHVRTQDGRTGAVRYDRNTQVIYRQQQYPVTALERGDVAQLEVQQLQNNEIYVSRVLVQQSVRERTGQAGTGTQGGAHLQQVSGRVGQINGQAGMFELQTTGGTLTVSLPANASAAAVDRFRRLRTGESVSVEGSFVTAVMVELNRFL
jgi:hypothetical protein